MGAIDNQIIKASLLSVLTIISGCGGWTQESYFHNHYRYLNDRMIGLKNDTGPACSADPSLTICKKYILDDMYYETYSENISPFSTNKGVCRTYFKVRRSDDVIVGWRFEGEKYDCLSSPK